MFNDRFEGVWAEPYLNKLLFKVAMVLVIIGALNWLIIGLTNVNLVASLFGSLTPLVYILVGLSALGIMFRRDTYLPFLGSTLAPCSVLQNKEPPGATKSVSVVITPNTKVLYWAAEPGTDDKLKHIKSWKEAYGQYENAGVTTSNGEGVAVFKVRDPQSYKVPFKGKLDSHIHYRVCGDDAGFMGAVRTVSVNHRATGVEGFECPCNKALKNWAESAARAY
jgi:uncharacterized membrane protein YuzA (DUF378 family)